MMYAVDCFGRKKRTKLPHLELWPWPTWALILPHPAISPRRLAASPPSSVASMMAHAPPSFASFSLAPSLFPSSSARAPLVPSPSPSPRTSLAGEGDGGESKWAKRAKLRERDREERLSGIVRLGESSRGAAFELLVVVRRSLSRVRWGPRALQSATAVTSSCIGRDVHAGRVGTAGDGLIAQLGVGAGLVPQSEHSKLTTCLPHPSLPMHARRHYRTGMWRRPSRDKLVELPHQALLPQVGRWMHRARRCARAVLAKQLTSGKLTFSLTSNQSHLPVSAPRLRPTVTHPTRIPPPPSRSDAHSTPRSATNCPNPRVYTPSFTAPSFRNGR
mgnify:CR=1 FL=1